MSNSTEFSVKTQNMRTASDNYFSYASKLEADSETLKTYFSNIQNTSSSYEFISNRTSMIQDRLELLKNYINTMASTLSDITNDYEESEKRAAEIKALIIAGLQAGISVVNNTGNTSDINQKLEECVVYGIESDTANNPKSLTVEQQQANAEYIYYYLTNQGWSKEAICALLGNIQQECSMNPASWQNKNKPGLGYGIVQWSPSTDFTNWYAQNYPDTSLSELTETDPKQLMNIQLDFLSASYKDHWYNGMGVNTYGSPCNLTFTEFTTSTESVSDLAYTFEACYERSGDNPHNNNGREIQTYTNREKYANQWYDYFSNY